MINPDHKVQVWQPTGVADQDSNIVDIRRGDYITAHNMVFRHNKGFNLKGNNLVSLALPSGINRCIGRKEDKKCESIFLFIWNSNNNHLIVRLYPFNANATEVVIQSSVLNFTQYGYITHIEFIDGRFLAWTDGQTDKLSITGTFPKIIDVPRATNLASKTYEFELTVDTQSGAASTTYSLEVTDHNGVNISGPTVFYTSTGHVGDPDGLLTALNTALTTLGGYDIIQLDRYLIITPTTPGNRIVITSSVTDDIRFAVTNAYPVTWHEDYLSLLRKPPKCAPTGVYRIEPTVNIENNLFGSTFQFRYKYIYWDDQESKWSPISYVPSNFDIEGFPTDEYNELRIRIDDDLVNSDDWRSLIRKLKVAVRYGDNEPWRLIETTDISRVQIGTHDWKFYNDASFSIIPSDENSTDDVQALGLFDFIPRIAGVLKSISDKEGNVRFAIGAGLEGFDTVDTTNTDIVQTESGAVPTTTYPNEQTTYFFLKRGGDYKWYIQYEDGFGRSGPAQYVGRTKIPFTANTLVQYRYPIIDFTFDFTPPVIAERYRILRSKNLNQSIYIQFPIIEVTYWKITHESENPTSTTFAAGDANYIGFVFSSDALPEYDQRVLELFFTTDDHHTILVEGGDRLQFLRGNGVPGLPPGTDFQPFNFPIAGYRVRTTGATAVARYEVFIKNDASFPNFSMAGSQYILSEVYRPKGVDDEIAYDVTECYDIVNPGDPSRAHQATHTLDFHGDTILGTNVEFFDIAAPPNPFNVDNVERMHYYAFKSSNVNNLGRANIPDPYFKERFLFSRIRTSGVYTPFSGLNGLNQFRGTDFIQVNQEYGIIKALRTPGSVLLAICENKSQPIYVSKDQILTIDNSRSLSRTDKLLNIANELRADYGTHHPESIEEEDGFVYGFDVHKGIYWRYANNGMFPISSYKWFEYFNAKGEEFQLLSSDNKIISQFVREHSYLFVSFQKTDQTFETVIFDPSKDGWVGTCDLDPEQFAQLGNKWYSIKGGLPWEQEYGGNRTTFFTVNNEAYFVIAANQEPETKKLFRNLSVLSNRSVFSPSIIVPSTHGVPFNYTSKVPLPIWESIKGRFFAPFLRDETDPTTEWSSLPGAEQTVKKLYNGRILQGEVAQIKIQFADATLDNEVNKVFIYYQDSNFQ